MAVQYAAGKIKKTMLKKLNRSLTSVTSFSICVTEQFESTGADTEQATRVELPMYIWSPNMV